MLEGKNIIVTGASGAIGFNTVKLCLEQGAFVFALAHQIKDHDLLGSLQTEYPSKLETFYFDMTDFERMKEVVKQIFSKTKEVDGLVNNSARLSENCMFVMNSMQAIREVFELNFFAQVKITQLIARNMMRHKKGSSIVNISSIAALDGDPGMMEYCASKAALIGVTYKLSRELAPFKIRVNAVAPGITESKMISKMPENFKEESLMRSISKKVAKPQSVAEIIAFLLSDKSMQINGQVIRTDA